MRPGKRSSAATGCAEDPGISGAVATSLQTAEARSKRWRFGLCQTTVGDQWFDLSMDDGESIHEIHDGYTMMKCPSFPKLDFDLVMAPMVS